MTLSLSNSSNDIQNGVLTIALPNITGFDATSVNPTESNNVSFNPNTRTLTWKVAALAAHAGQFSSARKLQFSETIKPSLTDTGNYVVLGHNISFNGTDTFTNLPVSATISDLTTNSALGSGQVQSGN
jgi:microcystin-dependent protein